MSSLCAYLRPGKSRTLAAISPASGHSFSTISRGPHRDLLYPRNVFFTEAETHTSLFYRVRFLIAEAHASHKFNPSQASFMNQPKTEDFCALFNSVVNVSSHDKVHFCDFVPTSWHRYLSNAKNKE